MKGFSISSIISSLLALDFLSAAIKKNMKHKDIYIYYINFMITRVPQLKLPNLMLSYPIMADEEKQCMINKFLI